MATIRIPDGLLDRVMREVKARRKRLAYKAQRATSAGTARAEQAKLDQLDWFAHLVTEQRREQSPARINRDGFEVRPDT